MLAFLMSFLFVACAAAVHNRHRVVLEKRVGGDSWRAEVHAASEKLAEAVRKSWQKARASVETQTSFQRYVTKLRKLGQAFGQHSHLTAGHQRRAASRKHVARRGAAAKTPAAAAKAAAPGRKPMSFKEFVRLRLLARTRPGRTGNFWLDTVFFTNVDRLEDRASKQLAAALGSLRHKELKVALIFCVRHLSSPKDTAVSGPAVLAAILKKEGVEGLATALDAGDPRCASGFMTYDHVLSRSQVACVLRGGFAKDALALPKLAALVHLRDKLSELTNSNLPKAERKCLPFHSLQVALDLVAWAGFAVWDDCQTCPTSTGSAEGLQQVRRLEGDLSLSLEQVAATAGICPVWCQTALCEYNKFLRCWAGAKPMRFYKPS